MVCRHLGEALFIILCGRFFFTRIDIIMEQPILCAFRWFEVYCLQRRESDKIVGVAGKVTNHFCRMYCFLSAHREEYLLDELIFPLRQQ